ncbi:TIGR04002 family protein [Hespellia stercorisuis DSM 15480]|uniref:TIGR04002 family protein n=2 Tax=Hespellia stercorisuis TaxID=180311 RepID=A0A1M6MCW3_9FIRM|nr:TIGR04002 family protein [Hespellia stercorisuis]SHJ81260.1 TIGR04002 family protein [Hespellia stercorisuis DSM 15480]
MNEQLDKKVSKNTDRKKDGNKDRQDNKMVLIAMTGLFAAMITIMTAYIFHIPYGLNGGYIHFGDMLIYVAAVLLPQPYGLAAAAIGGGIADILTAPMWAPATIIIKALITLPFTQKSGKILTGRNIAAPFIAGIISAVGYYLAEGILFGSFASATASFLGSAIQSGGSMILFFVFATALDRVHIKNKAKQIGVI